jgi:hypothetical protein
MTEMLGGLSRKAWLGIAAAVAAVVVVVVVVVALAGGDDDGDDDVQAGTSSTTATVEPSSTTDGTEAPGATTATTAAPSTTACDEPGVNGEVMGRTDLDADGVDELFVKTGSGAATDIVGVFRVEDCQAVQATSGGSPAEFPVGATVRNISGLHAEDGTLVVYSGTSADGQQFDVTWRTLRLDGDVLTEVGSDRGTAQPGDELFTTASSFGV